MGTKVEVGKKIENVGGFNFRADVEVAYRKMIASKEKGFDADYVLGHVPNPRIPRQIDEARRQFDRQFSEVYHQGRYFEGPGG